MAKDKDFTIVISASLFVSSVFLFLNMNLCYNKLDTYIWFGTAIGLLFGPILYYQAWRYLIGNNNVA